MDGSRAVRLEELVHRCVVVGEDGDVTGPGGDGVALVAILQLVSRVSRAFWIAGASNGRSEASTTRLPPTGVAAGSRPMSTGAPMTATCSKTLASVATSARAKARRPWSMRSAAYRPSSLRARCTSLSASVVREVPGHADAPEGVADDEVTAVGFQPLQAQPAVLHAYVDAGGRPQIELFAVDATTPPSISETRLRVPGRTAARSGGR
ncbi:hypothetical protein SMICM304S_11501 [Streptomyces microflavus]